MIPFKFRFDEEIKDVSVLSLKGKNQRNFKKTKIAKRQKGPKKKAEQKNELVHFLFSPLFRLRHLRCPSQSRFLLWRRLLPCKLQQDPFLKFFAELFFKKATVSPRQTANLTFSLL